MKPPLRLSPLSEEQLDELKELYRTTKDVRLRTRSQMILLAAEQGMIAPTIAQIVGESDQTVRNWFKRYQAEGIEGLKDAPMPGAPRKVTPEHVKQLVEVVRLRPRSLGLPFSRWTLARLADYLAEQTGIRVEGETVRDNLKGREVFYYADEFNLSWLPTLRALWSPKGQQVMIPTPGQPTKHYGLGAVNYHTGETVVLFRRRKRRREIAELLQALVDKHPTETVYVAWDNADTHQDAEVDAVVRGAAGRLVLLYLPTYSPWLNPIEMLWRHFRREVTHCELFESVRGVISAAQGFFYRFKLFP